MSEARLLQAQVGSTFILKLVGDVRLSLGSTLDSLLQPAFSNPQISNFLLDLTGATNLDSTTLGLLAKIALHTQNRGLEMPHIFSPNPDITQLLESMGFRQFFRFFNQPLQSAEQLEEIPHLAANEESLKQQVLTAHKTLMLLNDTNKQVFADLIEQLEN